VSLAPALCAAIIAADQRAAVLEEGADREDQDWEDEEPVLSRPPTPLSRPVTPLSRAETPTASSSGSASRSSSPLSDPPTLPAPPVPPTASKPTHKLRAAKGKKARRQHARVAKAQAARFGPIPQLKHSQDHREHSPLRTSFQATDLPCDGWTGLHLAKKACITRPQVHTRDELLAKGVELVQWEGQCVFLGCICELLKSLAAIPS
jgi:hypothetical protein